MDVDTTVKLLEDACVACIAADRPQSSVDEVVCLLKLLLQARAYT